MADEVTKEREHELIERRREEKVPEVLGLLAQYIPLALWPPEDKVWWDEPMSEGEERAAAKARATGYSGPSISHEELLAEMGLTQEDLDEVGRVA